MLQLQMPQLHEFTPEAPLEWRLLDGKRQRLRQGVSPLRDIAKAEPCELVLAAPDVLLLDMAVPDFTPAKLHLALPGLAEDSLLGQVEDSFIVASPRDTRGRATLAVVDKNAFRHVTSLLQRAGFKLVRAIPEPLSLPSSQDAWRVRLRAGYGCVRTGPLTGFSTSSTSGEPPAELLLALKEAAASPPACIEVEGSIAETAWREALGATPLRVVAEASEVAPEARLNLLQFAFAQHSNEWKVWRPAMLAAGACLLVFVIGLNLHTWKLQKERSALRTQLESSFRQAFPETHTVLDPVLQARQAVERLRAAAGTTSGRDFLSMASALSALTARADLVKTLEYSHGVLRAQVSAELAQQTQWQQELSKASAGSGLNLRFAGDQLVIETESKP